eukprot:Protomagalhaensia_sp_Gyna_25__4025@NODE_362_length_3715_cov_57_036181_g279_i0_p1_GENE_NODE_362_length_3715_cov_57_036181_g279_i0NODE_362_length_3715_cov_57_036181_g279_i0_p1_ORF_typecomplete_len568_score63_45Sugar_tr/PF00083_24/3_4e02Sugar_tr/PF00083_24/4_6e68MFS_1/PF07690_16/4_6e12MFS_1/PF07690_16/0_077MFS_4/PF06779_14/2_9e06MFS_4/PF06779_14/1_8e03_NODE_362_length_3715_cov_57_036181_g279_i05282231
MGSSSPYETTSGGPNVVSGIPQETRPLAQSALPPAIPRTHPITPVNRLDPAGDLGELLAEHTIGTDDYDLDRVQMGRRSAQQWKPVPHTARLVWVSCCGTFIYGYCMATLNGPLPWISWDLGVCSASQSLTRDASEFPLNNYCWMFKTLTILATFIGALAGAWGGAGLLRHSGRRAILRLNLCFHIIAAATSAAAEGIASFVWSRVLTGAAIGLTSVVAPVYLAEMTPQRSRSLNGLFSQSSVTLGILFANILAMSFPLAQHLPTGAPPRRFVKVWWRLIVAIPIIPALLGLDGLSRWFPYETPHYYLRCNQLKEAKAVLQRVYEKEFVIEELSHIAAEIQAARAAIQLTPAEVMKRQELRKPILLSISLASAQQLTGINVFVVGSVQILSSVGWSGAYPATLSCILFLLNFICTLPVFCLMKWATHRQLMLSGCMLMTLSFIPTSIGAWNRDNVAHYGVLAGMLVYITAFAATFGAIMWVHIFTTYPVEIRGAAGPVLPSVVHWAVALVDLVLFLMLPTRLLLIVLAALNIIVTILLFLFVHNPKEEAGSTTYGKPSWNSSSSSSL